MIFTDCAQFVTAPFEATTEIYWKVVPFDFDGEQARDPDTVPQSEATMPWWLLHGVRPMGKPKDEGSFSVHTFSEEQQDLYGVDENGEVVDQARFERKLPGVLAGGAATPAGRTAPGGVAPLSGAAPTPPAAAGVDWLSGPGGAAGPDEPTATMAGIADQVAGGPGPAAPASASDGTRGEEPLKVEDDADDDAAWFADHEVAFVSPNSAPRGLRQPVGAPQEGLMRSGGSPQASHEPGGSLTVRYAVVSAVVLGSALLIAVHLRRHRGAGVQDNAREGMVMQTPRVPDEETCAAE